MSDKLNKLGFLAGRLFAKTVNEVKPLLTKDEPSHTDPAPVISPEEKIRTVLNLLSSKKVGSNINDLLTNYKRANYFESIEVKTTKEVGLSEELTKEFKVKEISQQLNFYYKEKSLQILLTNNISEKNANASYLHRYDLIVLYNGLCVFRNSDRVPGSFRADNFQEDSIKSFKNGIWLDDLQYLKSHFELIRWNKNKSERNDKLKSISDKLDLDPID